MELQKGFAKQYTDSVLRMKFNSDELNYYYQTFPDLNMKFIFKRLVKKKGSNATHTIAIKMTTDVNNSTPNESLITTLTDYSSFDNFCFVLSKEQFSSCVQTRVGSKTIVQLSAVIKNSSIRIINTY